MTPLANIAAMLRERAGLDAATMGTRALAQAVRRRIAARGLDAITAYGDLLAQDEGEWQALLESVVVPETWFFRDRNPFAFLAEWAKGRPPASRLNILSLPCATGEEAWSIAIVLAAAGRAAESFTVEAFDLSERALATACTGVYPPRSLRGHRVDAAWARFLSSRDDGGVEVAAELRPSVRFARGNLAEVGRLLAGRTFDVIFSRNLLIYCDEATRRGAIDTFSAVLREGGLLFLGHAESLPARTPGFVREKPLNAFVYRRTESPARISAVAPAVPAVSHPRSGTPDRVRRGARGSDTLRRSDRAGTAGPMRTVAASSRNAATAILERAQVLANDGKLEQAESLARQLVEQTPTDAAGQALLGVVLAAQGRDAEAAESLRRALYLDPTSEEALLHLPLVLERLGDASAASRLRQRARRSEVAR